MKTIILHKVRLTEHMSQETPCFTAELILDGQKFQVRNDGSGGANRYWPHLDHETEKELDAWAAANNPPITECGGFPIDPPLSMNFETWTFTKAFDLCES